jgi:hypothetical protein
MLGVLSNACLFPHPQFLITACEILVASVEMIKIPYSRCIYTLRNVDQLVGLKLERGLSKHVASRIGGSSGCTHLFELVMTGTGIASNAILDIYAEGKD